MLPSLGIALNSLSSVGRYDHRLLLVTSRLSQLFEERRLLSGLFLKIFLHINRRAVSQRESELASDGLSQISNGHARG